MVHDSENILSDDYPVHPGYIYLADGEPIESMVRGTVRDLKRDLINNVDGYDEEPEIRNCDLQARDLL